MSEPDRLAATRGSDRPRAHGGTSDTEIAIFDATERLLAEIPLHDLSVAQIIAAAGISRATFYFYFSSKFAVVSGLLARVMQEIFTVVSPFTMRDDGIPPETALEQSLSAAIALWASHRPALRAVHEHWNTTDELRTLWLGVVDRFTEAIAVELERERSSGLTTVGADSRQIAASLLWSTQSVLYAAGLGIDPNLPDEQSALAPLMALWGGALYSSTAR
jgi:AcrR family transcriptional regulator